MGDSHLPTVLRELTDAYEALDGLQVYVYEQLTEQKRAVRSVIDRVELLISELPDSALPVEMPCEACGDMHTEGHGECGCQHC